MADMLQRRHASCHRCVLMSFCRFKCLRQSTALRGTCSQTSGLRGACGGLMEIQSMVMGVNARVSTWAFVTIAARRTSCVRLVRGIYARGELRQILPEPVSANCYFTLDFEREMVDALKFQESNCARKCETVRGGQAVRDAAVLSRAHAGILRQTTFT